MAAVASNFCLGASSLGVALIRCRSSELSVLIDTDGCGGERCGGRGGGCGGGDDQRRLVQLEEGEAVALVRDHREAAVASNHDILAGGAPIGLGVVVAGLTDRRNA